MQHGMTKAEVLDALHTERSRWEVLLAQVGEERMTEQIAQSWWSVKDIIAHVAWYERQTAELLQPQTRELPAKDWLWDERQDKRNAILFKEFRDRPLPDVLADSQRAYLQLVAAVQATPEEGLRSPQESPGMLAAWQPWKMIATHSYDHYRQHESSLREFLATLEATDGGYADGRAGATASRSS